jgi:hypothetical protein
MAALAAHVVRASLGDLYRVYDADRPVGGADGNSIAPALDTAAAVIILALPLPCESPGPTSLKRMTAVPTTATNAATITGIESPRRSFL